MHVIFTAYEKHAYIIEVIVVFFLNIVSESTEYYSHFKNNKNNIYICYLLKTLPFGTEMI